MKLPLKNRSGFTLMETMVAVLLFAFFSAGLFSLTSFIHTMSYEDRVNSEITNEARILMEKIVWGTRPGGQAERHGIWEASVVDTSVAGRIDFTDPSGNQRTVQVNGTNVEYIDEFNQTYVLHDPNGSAADDANNYSTSITFNVASPGVVDVNVVLGRRKIDRWIYASMSTRVAMRN